MNPTSLHEVQSFFSIKMIPEKIVLLNIVVKLFISFQYNLKLLLLRF